MRTAADIVLHNGTVATQDPARPSADAVALARGRILAVGDGGALRDCTGPGTETVDLEGRMVVPGFIDSHIHFYEWALQRQDLPLGAVGSLEDLLEKVREADGRLPPGRWILGRGWNETDWARPRMPTRRWLDEAAPERPVVLWRCDLHLAAANSAALRLAGIDADTPDPPEGRIERDEAGRPTGILREMAINRVRRAIPVPDAGQVAAAFEDGIAALHRRGVTGIHDVRLMGDEDGARALQAFQGLEGERRLALRCWATLPGHRLDEAVSLGLRTGMGGSRLRIGHVKFFADGGMGARTAWVIDPYRDAENGMPLMDMAELARRVRTADAAGLAVMVHAVGDRANREVIGVFEGIREARGASGLPPAVAHRIEHVQMIRPEDLERLRRLGVALCVTPANMVLDMNLIDRAVGEKGRWTYAFRRLMDTGAPVLFSSDCPVCDPDPLAGIHAAVSRQRPDGTPAGGWHPENRVTAAEALGAYTVVPARAQGTPDLGVIAPGARGDLAVLRGDLLTGSPERIPDNRVDMTLFDGRMVHRRF